MSDCVHADSIAAYFINVIYKVMNMNGQMIKPLALLVSVMALGLSTTQSAVAAEVQYESGHIFNDSLDTTVRPCTNSRCDISGGFDRLSDTDYPHELPRLSGAQPIGNSSGGGGWANQQETIRLSAAQPNENSGGGGGWANQQETIRLSGAQPNGNSGGGGGWANQQETIRLSGSQPNGNSSGGGGWANQQETLPATDKGYEESLDYSMTLAGGAVGDKSCAVCQLKRAITLDEMDKPASAGWANQKETIQLSASQHGGGSGAGGGWVAQSIERSWLESNALSRAVRLCTSNQCSHNFPA